MRRRITIAVTATSLSLAVAAVTAEIVVRGSLEHRITSAARTQLGGDPNVGIGSTPALFDAVTGTISTVSIDDQGYATCNLGAVDISLNLSEVTHPGQQVHVQSSKASVTVPVNDLASRVDAKLGGSGQASVTADASRNALVVSIAGGLVTFEETPTLADTQIRLTPSDVTLEGAPAPQGVTQRVTSSASETYQMPQLPLGMSVTSVDVSDDGLVVNAAGGAATLGTSGGHPKACTATSSLT